MIIKNNLLPGPDEYLTPDAKDPRFYEVKNHGGGRLFTHERRHPRVACLFFHGNGESAADWTELLDFFHHQSEIQFFLAEYRGYSSEGENVARNEVELIEDALACYDAIDEGVKIILWGRSLGGAVATQVASLRQPSKLILQSTFPCLAYAIKSLYSIPVPEFICLTLAKIDGFELNTEGALTDVTCPVLLLHGDQDELFPFETAIPRLERSITSSVDVVKFEGGHNDDGLKCCRKRILGFMGSCF